jgi:DNA processing protein
MNARQRNEFWASLALKHTRGIGPRTWKRLCAEYGGPYQAVMNAANWPARKLASAKQAEELRSQAWRATARQEWEHALASDFELLLWTDPRYPEHLREIPDPPLYLYCAGDLSLLANPCVALVGTRNSTAYGRDATRDIGAALSAAGVTIVSGMAYGIDRQAHLAGLSGLGGSIAVLGAGLDIDYPAGNSDVRALLLESGLLVSELAPGAPAEPRNFPVRNRIISGLSLGVTVMEASLPSGSMITARLAMEQGREVFAVPGPRDSNMHLGCFELINQGAKLVCSAEDILRELAGQLGPCATPKPSGGKTTKRPKAHPAKASPPQPQPDEHSAPHEADLTPDERDILDALRDATRLHIDALGERLGWEPSALSRALVLLELRGVVRQLPGMIYCAC